MGMGWGIDGVGGWLGGVDLGDDNRRRRHGPQDHVTTRLLADGVCGWRVKGQRGSGLSGGDGGRGGWVERADDGRLRNMEGVKVYGREWRS